MLLYTYSSSLYDISITYQYQHANRHAGVLSIIHKFPNLSLMILNSYAMQTLESILVILEAQIMIFGPIIDRKIFFIFLFYVIYTQLKSTFNLHLICTIQKLIEHYIYCFFDTLGLLLLIKFVPNSKTTYKVQLWHKL